MTRLDEMKAELAAGNGIVFHDGELDVLIGVADQAMKVANQYTYNGNVATVPYPEMCELDTRLAPFRRSV